MMMIRKRRKKQEQEELLRLYMEVVAKHYKARHPHLHHLEGWQFDSRFLDAFRDGSQEALIKLVTCVTRLSGW